jgi:periplasmic copper chaperone A
MISNHLKRNGFSIVAIKIAAAYALFMGTTAAFAHMVLEVPVAQAGTSYKAALRIGHGCAGSPTTAVTVLIPSGFQGAQPKFKPGWVLSVKREKLAQPYSNYGKTVTEDVSEITWTAASREYALPDAYFDEFVLRGGLPKNAQALWFKVLQMCESGRNEWTQIPALGVSTKGLKFPAALLELTPSGPAGQGGHQH